MNTKEELHNKCLQLVQAKIASIQQTIFEIQESMRSETKSSVGDKHETGRAMLQLEREKAGNQLAEAEKLMQVLKRIPLKNDTGIIGLGSVVYTSNFNYYMAVSLGVIEVNDQTFYAISPQTPIGKLLLGKQVGEHISFQGQSFQIENID